MNLSGNSTDGAALRVRKVFASQRAAFEADPYPLAERRREKIKALKRQISRYQDVLADAMSTDFGFRAPAESKMLDLLGSMLEADHAIAHLKSWMKPSRRATELLFLTNSLAVTYQPKGVVGVIVPWNRHCARVSGLLADAREKGATVVPCADYDVSRNSRQMPLHIVTDCTSEMRIMNEELFGPILPVVPYDSLEDAIRFVNAGDRPLAMYCFSHDAAERNSLLRRTHAGGVTVNDWGWHVVNHDAPFGGVGNSGMGTYHGVEGFRELSHAKTVFKRHRFFPIGLFYPPYGNLASGCR